MKVILMKLVYQLENKLFWVHNFLPNNFYKQLHDMVFKCHRDVKVDANKTWDKKLLYNLKPPQKLDVADTFNKQYTTLLRHQPFINLIKENISFTVHKMNKDTGIAWHSDGRRYAATFYINKRWNENWGGEFMFKTETQSGFIPFVGNSLILIKSPLLHKVNTILSPTISRFSIQSFTASH